MKIELLITLLIWNGGRAMVLGDGWCLHLVNGTSIGNMNILAV